MYSVLCAEKKLCVVLFSVPEDKVEEEEEEGEKIVLKREGERSIGDSSECERRENNSKLRGVHTSRAKSGALVCIPACTLLIRGGGARKKRGRVQERAWRGSPPATNLHPPYDGHHPRP